MAMDSDRLQDIVSGAPATTEELTALTNEYPYWLFPAVKLLEEGGTDVEESLALRRKVAAVLGDTPALERIAGMGDAELFDNFYPDSHAPELSTDDAIGKFLDKFGGGKGAQDGVEEIPITPPQVYFTPGMPERVEEVTKKAAKADEGPALTESLALVMIKNGNYSKALEIISALNLNNSQKSAYFADQMRFLRKLILNQQKS